MGSLHDRVVLLTGATGGLGPELAKVFAREGAHLVLSGRNRRALEGLCQELARSGVRAAPVPADLSDPDEAAGLIERAERALGPLDILVHNAAVEVCSGFERLTDAEIDRMTRVNLIAPMVVTRRAVPGMLERGRGHVVFVSSLSGLLGTAFEAPYAATKGALIALGRSLRAEFIDRPVSFSVVSPGSVAEHGMFARRQSDGIHVPRAVRLTTPGAVAHAVVRAVKADAPELLVSPGPVRAGLVMALLSPRLSERLNERLGVGRLFRAAALARGRA